MSLWTRSPSEGVESFQIDIIQAGTGESGHGSDFALTFPNIPSAYWASVTLNWDSAIPPKNDQPTVIRWGEILLRKNSDNPANSLMQANLNIDSFQKCPTFIPPNNIKIWNDMFCATGKAQIPNPDACYEYTVAPVVKLGASTCTTCAIVGDALQYVKNSLVVEDDWVGNLIPNLTINTSKSNSLL